MNRKLARVFDRPALAQITASTYSNARFATLKARKYLTRANTGEHDGLPRPPDRLIYLVAGGLDWKWYLESGRFHARQIHDSLARQGAVLADCGSALDFGCGSGRIMRHLAPHGGDVKLFGVDYNPRLVAWCAEHLRFATFTQNQPLPPLEFGDGTFGLVYAYSVFTHLTDDGQRRWRDELARILKPGGYLWVTIHNARNNAKLSPEEMVELEAGGLVVRFADAAGNNYCTAYPSDEYLSQLFVRDQRWELLERAPAGPDWDDPIQDYLLLRRV